MREQGRGLGQGKAEQGVSRGIRGEGDTHRESARHTGYGMAEGRIRVPFEIQGSGIRSEEESPYALSSDIRDYGHPVRDLTFRQVLHRGEQVRRCFCIFRYRYSEILHFSEPSIQSMTFSTLMPPNTPRLNRSMVRIVFGKLSLMDFNEPNSLFLVSSPRTVMATW